jgi:hypothetical protein
MSFYERHKPVILGAVLAIVLVSLSLGLAYLATYGLPLSDRFSAMLLSLSTVAFVGVFIALMVAIAQFRKSMAKPKLGVAFSKEGATGVGINIRRDKREDYNLHLWISNNGNAVTKLFQIDFEIPDIFDPELKGEIGGHFLPYQVIRPSTSGDTKIISFCNDWDFCVFVNSPVEFLILSLKSLPQNYKEYEKEYEIRYRVFGDWAETQEGKLKVICKKR